MLTGQTAISKGRIYTTGLHQRKQLKDICQSIGYCPQFDSLLNSLTCRETMEMFARLRGIPGDKIKEYVEYMAKSFDFIQHIDKMIEHLRSALICYFRLQVILKKIKYNFSISGGNKRKLSISLALMGDLSVILLDEPTAGMDPISKRNVWNVITQLLVMDGKSIVLSTHSMEDCEALCTRVAILVDGKCKCLGSPEHLINKFCKGFELKIKVKMDK